MTSALIVIDVQRALFETSPPPFEAAHVLARINALAKRARAAGAPVVYVQHESPGSDLAHGGPGWDLDMRLATDPTDLRVRKTTPDSFLRTELAQVLADRGVTHLVVCGYATEFCVDTSVRRAAGLGLAVTLAADAHTTHDKPHADGGQIRAHHNATLPAISSFGVKIAAVPAADLFAGGASR
ncbi:MAG TPA: cysteine hydrolase [Achromobacter sp.]|uniref:cysteine hydrolase family protein n=1 Tax=Achromobacter sp. TaxID=134375 RepID=UPI000EEF15AC|nr:cysteine hydrolase family protein [Achromobacter sp.]HAP26287.1 cysteine hydrolase [Achromobacter sp.]